VLFAGEALEGNALLPVGRLVDEQPARAVISAVASRPEALLCRPLG